MRPHSKEYRDYLASLEWAMKRSQALLRVGGKCQRCGATSETHVLQVHHLNYDRLGGESPEDLLVVCVPCHDHEDMVRQQVASTQRWNRRLDGWASKKYGEDWEDSGDADRIEEEFHDWVERRIR